MSFGFCKDCVYCKRITIIPFKGMPEYLSADGLCVLHAPVVCNDGATRFPTVRVEPEDDGCMAGCGDFEPAPKEERKKLLAKYGYRFLEIKPHAKPVLKQCQRIDGEMK